MRYFYEDLQKVLVGPEKAKWVWLGNVEVEQFWRDETLLSLPGSNISAAAPLVNRMGEMALFLAEPDDLVCLKTTSDPDFLAYVSELRGGTLPELLICEGEDAACNITESLLQSQEALEALREKAQQGYRLLPYGTSTLEERLAQETGLPLSTPHAETCVRVNSKVYSRQLAKRVGIRQVRGVVGHTLTELERGFEQVKHVLGEGGVLVVKDAMGVSGKGMVLIESEKKFFDLIKIMRRSAAKRGHERVEMVIEQWIERAKDINYQFLVSPDGNHRLYAVREAIVNNGVHFGHVSPIVFTDEQQHDLEDAFTKISQALADDGYYGVVGVDAMIGADGDLYPCLEINARFNMATYQNRMANEWIPADRTIFIRPFHLSLKESLKFADLRVTLGVEMYSPGDTRGVIINGFSTLNMAETDNKAKKGRLYTVLVGANVEECKELEARVESLLEKLMLERSV